MRIEQKTRIFPLIAVIIISLLFASCSSRGERSSVSGEESSGGISLSEAPVTPEEDIIPGAGLTDLGNDFPDMTNIVKDLWEENNDTVGWLRMPGTTIDDVVVWKEGDNDYYLRRDFHKRTYYYGIYFADKRSTFSPDGDTSALGRNTVIYGHSMSDNKDDVQFGPMRYYLEEDFAREHPYIFFSTAQEDLAWEVVAVFYTHFDIPYNRSDLTYSEFKQMLSETAARSIYNYDYDINEDDKFLTLSTCVYSLPGIGALDYPNPYRFGIIARLVPSGEKLKEQATFTKNSNIKAA